MNNKIRKAIEAVELIEAILKNCKHQKACDSMAEWLTGSGRLDELLGIVPSPGESHPVITYWRYERDKRIQQAGIFCRKTSMNLTLTELIGEIKEFSLVFDNYNLGNPNPLWTDVQLNLFWAFRHHSSCGDSNFPIGKTNLRKILMSHEFFRSAPELPERNLFLLKCNYEHRAKKTV